MSADRTPWRHNGKLLPWWVSFSQCWASRKQGRAIKRQLSKARRRSWKDGHQRGLAAIESTCNWKDW